MERKSPARQQRSSDHSSTSTILEYSIERLHPVSRGRVLAEFFLSIGPVKVACNLVGDKNGTPQFVAPKKIKDSWTQQFAAVAWLEPVFACAVLDRVVSAMPPKSEDDTDHWAEDQEVVFRRAVEAMDQAS